MPDVQADILDSSIELLQGFMAEQNNSAYCKADLLFGLPFLEAALFSRNVNADGLASLSPHAKAATGTDLCSVESDWNRDNELASRQPPREDAMTFAWTSFDISRDSWSSAGCVGALTQRLLACVGVLASALFLWGAANCTNSAPVVTNDTASNTGQLTYVDVLANDTEPDGELMTLAVTGGSCFSAGSVAVEDNLVRFLPSPAVPSACTVNYSATDFQGNSDTGTLTFAPLDISLIFADNFETGTTGAWDACSGCS